jgi:thiamine transport system permease protein
LAPIAFFAVFFAWPVATLVGRGFWGEDGFTGQAVVEVLSSARTWRIIGQTLGQAAAATVLAVLLGIPGACLLYRRKWPGRRLVRAFVAVPFVLPSVVVGVAFRSLLSGPLEFLDGTFWAVLAALVFFNYSVVVRTVGALWARLDTRAQDAARTLGATGRRVFWTVTLPALAPAVAAGAALTFLFCATAFGVVLVLGQTRYGTVETEIYFQAVTLLDLPAAAGLSIVQLAIVAAALLIANRARARSERALRLRGDAAEQPLTGRDWPQVVVTAGVVVGLLAAPLGSLLWRSVAVGDGFGLGNYARLGEAVPGLAVTVWDAVGNSLLTALLATAIALFLGAQVSYVLSRRPASALGRRALGALDAAFMLPLGVSAVTVGFGFLITLNRPPLDLRTSWVLVPIAQALVALPLVVRTLLPTWRAIDPRWRQAAATLGAGPGRVLATIDAPYLLRGLGLAVGFAFATSLGEFGATSFLARPDRPTLPVVVYRLLSRPDNFGLAMAACVVLTVLTAAVMAAGELVGPPNRAGALS